MTHKCTLCRKPGHNRSGCPEKTPDPLPPDIALQTMITPLYATWLVTENAVGEALANATRALAGRGAGDALLQALAELDLRARNLSPEEIATARDLRQKADAAQAAYASAAAKIQACLSG